MRFEKPAPLNPRLTRAMRWAALWVRWLQSVLAFFRGSPLSRQAEAIAQGWLSEVADLIARYIVIAAAHRMRQRPERHGGRPRHHTERAIMRAIIGGKLRRALRHKDAQSRAAGMAAVLRDMEAWIGALTRRLPCGLTRRAPLALQNAPLHGASARGAPARVIADTS